MFKKLLILSALLLPVMLMSQERYTVSGYVRDAETGEGLIGSAIIVQENGKGVISNEYGYYSLSLDAGNYTLIFSYLGYTNMNAPISLRQDQVLNMELQPSLQELEEVTISLERSNTKISQLETGSTRLNIRSIRKIPALLGEVDIIKAIQMLPGVQVTSEGSSGFSVRGGARDQNLIQLDEAPVYNASHLLGFFSIFNNDAIKDVKLYKGDIPASSGGRLASLLDIRMKEGNSKHFHGSGGIGTISSRLTLEGPIVPDRVSFLLAGRRTYADLFLLLSKEEVLRNTQLYFFDLNGKINFRINDNNKLYLSGYYGKDIYANDEFAGMYFGNRTFTLRWNHLFGQKLFSNFTLVNSYYFYDLGTAEDSPQFVNWKSNLEDYGAKGDFTWFPSPEHTFRFGGSGIHHTIRPGNIIARSQSGIDQSAELPFDYAWENGLYFSGESKLGENLSLRYGLRYSIFMNVGEATVYDFDSEYQVIDSSSYEQGEIFNVDHGPEPRFAVNYMLSEKHSFKVSYARTIQYLQLAANSSAGTPLEIWFPISPNIEPQISDQVSLGYFRNFLDNKMETSLELYYKNMNNSIDFRDHAQLILNPRLEGELRVGEATSMGAELYIKYETNKFTGWISYTLSRTMRDIPEINGGKAYSAPYDKPHDLSLVASYDISQRIGLGANWTYSTGIPFTLPSGRYEVLGNILPLYTGRNEYRLPDYHRLDFSLTIRGKQKPGKRWSGEWNLSVYNAYARKNVWALNFVQDEAQPDVTYAEMTYLFSIVPAITYNFRF